MYRTEKFMRSFRTFSKYYKTWLREMGIEEEQHPWQQFREPTPINTNQIEEPQKSPEK